MKKIIYLILLPISAWIYWEWSFSTAYNQKIELADSNKLFPLSVSVNGKELPPQDLNVERERQSAVKDLLIENKGNWEITFASYKPNLRLKAEGLDINILEDGIILNIAIFRSHRWQFRTKLEKTIYRDFLNRIH